MDKEKKEDVVKEPQTQGSENEPKKEKGGLLFAILASITALAVIGVVVGGVFYIIIRNNVNGLTDKYGESIKNVPLLNRALPNPPDPKDPANFSKDKLLNLYNQYKAQNEELKKQASELKKQNGELQKYKTNADAITSASEKMKADVEKEKADLEKYKKQIDELVARGDKQAFADYFVKVNSETAEKIYNEVVEEKKADEAAKQFAQLYEKMDTGSCAKIFEQLGASKIDLISYTLKNMKKDIAAEILGEMSNDFAAKITEKLANDYGVKFTK